MNFTRFLILAWVAFHCNSCKKNAFKEDREYTFIFSGTRHPFCKATTSEKYQPSVTYILQQKTKDAFVFVQKDGPAQGSNLEKDEKGLYFGRICNGQSTKSTSCDESYILKNGKMKYKWSRFKYIMIGEAEVWKDEFDCNTGTSRENDRYLIGTFTLQPKKK